MTNDQGTQTPLQDAAKAFLQNSIDHGFWPEKADPSDVLFPYRNFGEMLMLMTSELSEALEEDREGKTYVYTDPRTGKPEGIAVELADAVIRIFDTLASMLDPETDRIAGTDLTIDELFVLKSEYNVGRAHKHGKAY